MKIASMILCAGVGSRLKSSKTKVLHEVGGRPVAYWPIKHALSTTNVKPIVVVGHQADTIEKTLRTYFGDAITFAYQSVPDGTGGAVRAGLPLLDELCESVLVLYGDTPLFKNESIRRLVSLQKSSKAPVAMFSAFAPNPLGYGRIIRNEQQQIVNIVEEKQASASEREIKEVNPGVYVFDARFLRENIDKLQAHHEKNEFYLTDILQIYTANASSAPVESVEISFEEMHGVNDRKQLAFAEKILNQRLLEHWMLDGVTFIDPQSSYVEEGVVLSKDVTIYPGVHLRGTTRVGEGTVIENGSIIVDCVIGRDVRILPYSCCEKAQIGDRSSVGPFARLRPGAHLDEEVKIGNFVEVKNSRLKKGVKAGHLAYMGDAEIGENCNIGAGSITCNFDGKNKHKTVVESDAFIGSNSTLIAPLLIGKNSYVAGGSTIDQNVPPDNLAIGRHRQLNKERKRRNADFSTTA